VLKSFSYRIPYTHPLLSEHFDKFEQAGAIYVELKPNGCLQEIAANEREDEIFDKLGEWVRALCNGNWRTFIHDAELARLLAGEYDFFQPQAVLDPNLLRRFREVTVLSANFEETLCYKLWSQMGVNFVEHVELKGKLRKMPHSAELEIRYCFNRPWTDKKAGKLIDGTSVRECMLQVIHKDALAKDINDKILVLDNKKYESEELFSWKRLPKIAHGLNCFDGYNNVAIIGAFNPPPHTIRFLKNHFALDATEIKDGIFHQCLYQATMRSSLRDPDNHDKKVIYVPDKDCAEYLARMYHNAKIIKFGDVSEPKVGRPRQHASDKDRKAAKRQELRDQKVRAMADQLLLGATITAENRGRMCPETPYKNTYKGINGHILLQTPHSIKIPESNQCVGSVYKNIYSKMPVAYIRALPIADQIKLLHELWTRHVASKEDALLISPSLFKPVGRKYEQIVSTLNIWLDFDEGDLLPDDFAKLFPRLKFVIFNSYHHRTDRPRFRVVLFTSTPLTIEAYEMVYKLIRAKLKEAGYATPATKQALVRGKQSGLDWSKHVATSLFYLPAQAEVAEESFFQAYDDDEREAIDVLSWLKNYHEPVVVDDAPDIADPADNDAEAAPQPINEANRQAATSHWRTCHKNTGNSEWFAFAWSLACANVPLPDIERTLHVELAHAPKKYQRKLRSQIKTIVAFIRKHYRPKESRGASGAPAERAHAEHQHDPAWLI
jgi:hypothetical protein